MKRIIALCVFASATFAASAQLGDTLKTRVLEMIVFEGVQPEGDTLQNFYRANASATTENILSRMKGVHLIRRGAFGQEPVFRSLSGGQLNVTIDGMRIFGACTDKMDPVTIYVEPQNLSSLQAVLGTEGSAFGSTFGGTLNMKLAGPVVGSQKLSGETGMDYQSASQGLNVFSRMNFSRSKSAYRVSGTLRKSENYRAGDGQLIPFSQYQKFNVAAGGKWTIGKTDTLQADVIYDHGRDIGFPALPMDVGEARAGIFSLTWRRVTPWLVFHNFTAKAYRSEIAHAMSDARRENTLMRMDMPGRSRTTGLITEADVHLFHDHQTLVKAEYFVNDLLGEMTMYPEGSAPMYMQTAPASTRKNAGMYINQQIRFNNRNKLFLSFRGDITIDNLLSGPGRQQWEVFSAQIASAAYNFAKTFSATFTHKIASNINLEIQNGYGERNATLNERYGYYLFNRFDGYDYLGNPDIANEKAWNSEATLQYFGNKIEWQFTPFYQSIRNYFMGEVLPSYHPMTVGARGVKQYNNSPAAYLHGLDAMMLARPLPSLQAIASVKYTHGKNAKGDALPLIPPLKTVASLRYEMPGFHVQAEWEWAAAQKRVNDTAGEQSTASYALLSIRTGWKINPFLHCNTGVENVFDKNYREHLDWGGIPRPGRNAYINIIYNFSTR